MRISDWSSDVCSSDLGVCELALGVGEFPELAADLETSGRPVPSDDVVDRDLSGVPMQPPDQVAQHGWPHVAAPVITQHRAGPRASHDQVAALQVASPVADADVEHPSELLSVEIGSASCRERVCQYV